MCLRLSCKLSFSNFLDQVFDHNLISSLISSIQQELAKHQNKVLTPEIKSPFKSKRDAIDRLLPYHVFNGDGRTPDELQEADRLFDVVSQGLLDRVQIMMDKYRYLLIKQSMKTVKPVEMVMLSRMFIEGETDELKADKKAVGEGKGMFLIRATIHCRVIPFQTSHPPSSLPLISDAGMTSLSPAPISSSCLPVMGFLKLRCPPLHFCSRETSPQKSHLNRCAVVWENPSHGENHHFDLQAKIINSLGFCSCFWDLGF